TRRVDQIGRTGLARNLQLRVVHIDRNRARTPKRCRRNRSQPHAATAKHSYRVVRRHPSACRSVESHRQWLDQCKLSQRQRRRVQLLARHSNALRQRTIALYTEGLVELARIHPSPPATRALPASRVRRQRHMRPHRTNAIARAHNGRRNLVPQHARKLHHRIAPAKCIQVGATQPHHPHLQQRFSHTSPGFRNLHHARLIRRLDNKSFHRLLLSFMVIVFHPCKFALDTTDDHICIIVVYTSGGVPCHLPLVSLSRRSSCSPRRPQPSKVSHPR